MRKHTSTVHVELVRLFTMLPVAVLLMLVMAMLLGGCKKKIVEPPVEPPSEIDITGVVEERSGVSVVPIAGVLVSLGTRVDTSDGQGRFEFTQVSPGNVALSFGHPSYFRLDTVFSVSRNTTVQICLKLQKREFVLSQTVGTTWEYSYVVEHTDPSPRYDITSGTHTWRIASVSVGSGETILQIIDVQNDSVYHQSPVSDTSYAQRNTVTFNITVGADTLTIDCPELPLSCRSLPRYFVQSSDTVQVASRDGFSHAAYVNGVGLVDYSFWVHGVTSIYTAKLRLLEFVP